MEATNFVQQFIGILPLVVVIFIFTIFIFLIFIKIKLSISESQKKISDELRFSVQPKFIQLSQGVSDLVDLAVEVWRMNSRIKKIGLDIPDIQKKGLESSIQKFTNYLSRYDIEIVDYTGEKYNEGLNLDILSVDTDPNCEIPYIKETVEPTVICKGQVVKKAKIILLRK